MTTYLQASTAALYVQWYQYAGGPLVDVNSVTITIKSLADNSTVLGPTSTGVTHPTTGMNLYNWVVGSGQAAADYLVLWAGTDTGTGDPVSASEIVTVATAVSGSVPTGLCAPWEPIWCNLPTGSTAVTGNSLAAATEVLWALSGQRFGLCQETIRPCRRDCLGGSWPFSDSWWEWTGRWPRPLLYQGNWYNITCGSCQGTCSCSWLEEAVLPGRVYDIVEVKVDGVPLAPTAYRLDDNRLLTRVDGGRWPICQDLAKADTQAGTWSVTARFGQAPTTLARQAVGELAAEFARACLGQDCRLPAHIQQLVRQGVTISYPLGVDLVERLTFGKMFLDTYNPHRLAGSPQVYDLDGPGFRRTG